MLTVLGFVVVAALCIAGAWWVGSLQGVSGFQIGDLSIYGPTPVMLTLLAVLFLLIYLLIRLLVNVWNSPRVLKRRRRDRMRIRGDLAVNRTLVALAANDGGAARREADRSRRMLGDTPLTLLLAAQAGRQAGREDEATEVFKVLAGRVDGRLLGLRGLLRQAMAREDWPTATTLAQQAEAAHPGAAWLTEERRRLALQTGEYGEALRLMGTRRRRDTSGAEARAALGVGAAEREADPSAALRLAKAAFESEPSLAPAAIAYAIRLREGGQARSGLDVLRRCWSLAPQPGVADAYLETVTEKNARYQAAGGLAAANPAHPDSSLLLASTAMEAGLMTEARQFAETARRSGLDDRRMWMLLADLAEVDGDREAAQEALRQIPAATAGPGWRCLNCGTNHAGWHVVCDACGVPGRIKWTAAGTQHVPVERIASPAGVEGLG